MSLTVICGAIQSHNLIQFHYALGDTPGIRYVEPHMVAYTEAGNLALSAWFVGGATDSQEGQGWREYLFDGITNVVILPQNFGGPRPGYNSTGGKKFFNIQCAL